MYCAADSPMPRLRLAGAPRFASLQRTRTRLVVSARKFCSSLRAASGVVSEFMLAHNMEGLSHMIMNVVLQCLGTCSMQMFAKYLNSTRYVGITTST